MNVFHEIDPNTWPRREIFYYFSKMAPTGYSLTAEVDITILLKAVKERKLRFFPFYLWLVTKNLIRQPEFTTAVKDGVIGYHDDLTPLYATWHEDTKTFSLLWTEYGADPMDFYGRYIENRKRYGAVQGILARPGTPPENAYTVSALPWTGFTHFAVHSYENKPYFFPSVEAGKYEERGGRVIMPLSLTCHHAATDGWHVAAFFDDLQKDMNAFERILEEKK